MNVQTFAREYQLLHFRNFKYFATPPEVDTLWKDYLSSKQIHIDVLTKPPQMWKGSNWDALTFLEKETALYEIDLIKFSQITDEDWLEYDRDWMFTVIPHNITLWKRLASNGKAHFNAN